MTKLTGTEINNVLKRERLIRKKTQPLLESGVDIKTINGSSIAGPGDLVVDGGGSSAGAVIATFDGGSGFIPADTYCDVYVPFNFTITKATLLADVSSSAVIGVWKDTYGNYPPTVADSITGAAPPTLSSAIKSQDAVLTGWTALVASGSTLRFNVNSVSGAKRLVLTLEGTKS